MRILRALALLLVIQTASLFGQPTRIQDTLRYAGLTSPGALASGRLNISWNAFRNSAGVYKPAGNLNSTITAGVLDVTLESTTNSTYAGSATPGISYTVRYFLANGNQRTENWTFGYSATPITMASVGIGPPVTTIVGFSPSLIQQGGAAIGDALVWDGTQYVPTAVGSSGLVGATFITQTPSTPLLAEQAMSLLATGLVKNTTSTGVQSIAVAGTDYQAPLGFTPENAANKGAASGYASLDSGTKIPAAQLPNPSAGALGGVRSLTCTSTDKLSAIGTDGIPVCSADTGGAGGITTLNTLTGATQTFTNDTNVTIVSGGTAHVITWAGTLADARVADDITLTNLTQITNRAISDTSGDLAASRVDDGGVAATQALFSGAGAAAGFRAIADADVPDTISLTNLTQIGTRLYSDLQSIPSTFAPSAHASSHQNSGTDEIATATPAANAIPKAGAGSTLAAGWIPTLNQNTTGTAGALAANGANCSANQFAAGVDAVGVAEGCTALPTTISGTANEITASAATGPVTLSLAATFDISGKTSTRPVKTGTATPGTCAVGELFFDTDAAIGLNIFGCTSTNTWTLQGDGTGSGSFGETSLAGLVNSQTIWDGANASRTLTAGLSGATDPVFTFANNSVSLNVPLTADLVGAVTGNASTATALAANGGNCSGNNFALGVDASGVGECAQPAFSNLSGAATDAQIPDSITITTAGSISGNLTGDVTSVAMATTLANIPTAVPMAGYLAATAIVAPGTPAAGIGRIYVDSTAKNLAVKDDAGVVKHGVQTRTATASNWIRAIDDAGATTISQPAFTDISGSVTDAQVPDTITVDLATLATTATTANAGDSATAFFSSGLIEAARGGTNLDSSASTGIPHVATGTWTVSALVDADIPNTITIDLATVATTANAGDSATAFFSSGNLEKAVQHAATVYNDAVNTGTAAMTLDLAASTVASAFKVPVVAGLTVAVNGAIGYDSTNHMLHGAQASADAKIPQFTITPANDECVKWVVSGSNYKLGSAGAACGTGSGANAALSNLASVSINTSLLAQTGVDLGSTTAPFRDLFLWGNGTFGSTYLRLTGTPTGNRVITFPDLTGTVVYASQIVPTSTDSSITIGNTGTVAPTFVINTSYLNGLYDQTAVSVTRAAGATLITPDSATTEGLRLGCGTRPSAPTAGALHCTATGGLEIYNGSAWVGDVLTASGTPLIHQVAVWTSSTDMKGIAVGATNTVLRGATGADPAFGSLVKADLPATTVYTDQANTFGAFAQDFSTSILELPNGTAPTGTDCDAAGEAGRIFIDTNAPSGQQVYACEGVAGWILQGGGGTAAWQALTNTADTATSYTSNNTAETVTFSFESAFGASQQFLIRQQTGNPTAGTLLDVRAADTNVTVFRAGDGTNGITVSQAGALTAEGSGTIVATTANAGDSATAFFSSGTIETARLGSGTADSTTFLRGDNTWATPSGSGTINSGVTNVIPKYTAATTLDDSLLSDDATTLSYTGTGGMSAASFTGNGTAASFVSLPEATANGTNFRKWIVVDALTASLDMKFANAVPTAAQVMIFSAPAADVSDITWGSLQDIAGAVTDAQVPNTITIDLATVATTANAGDSATSFFSTGTLENARLDADLGALGDNSTNGLWARTGAGTGSARTITGTASEISVADGDGVAGNPTLSLPASIDLGGKLLELPNGTAPTGTDCDAAGEAGRVFIDTNATSGQQVYVCEGVTGWILQGGAGSGTVSVVGAGSLTSTALVTGGGTTLVQTPSATTTLDTSGNISTPGSLTTGTGGSAAGYIQLGQGTAPSNGTTAIQFAAPASVTSYQFILPGAAGDGVLLNANASNTVTQSFVGTSGSGNFVRVTSATLVTPTLGAALATSINGVALPTCTSCTLDLADSSSIITSGAFAGTFTFTGTTGVTFPTAGTLATLAGTETLTGKTLDVEGTGNTITTVVKAQLKYVGCSSTTAAVIWDTLATLVPTGTCSAGTTETLMMRGILDFPDSDGLYSIQDVVTLPADFTGAIDVRSYWKAAATTGNVVWQVSTACRADAEVDDVAWNTASTTTETAKGTTLQLNEWAITGITATGCAAGEIMHIRVARDRTHASDSIAGVVSLAGALEITMRRAQ